MAWREIRNQRLLDWDKEHGEHRRKMAYTPSPGGTFLGICCLDCMEIYIYDVIIPEEKFYK